MTLQPRTPIPPPATPAPKVQISGLSKSFAGKQVLNDVSADVLTRKKSVLIGPAASGKTVLFKCITGLCIPDAGTIMVDGKPVPNIGTAEHSKFMLDVGVCFQQGGLLDSLTVWENIGFKLVQALGLDREQARAVAIEKLGMVDLPATTADLLPSELSGGMQKRVGIARALAGSPTLLLLDEPTAGLDPITTNTINKLITRSMIDIGATVLSITSDMDAARNDYDHLFMMNEGAIIWNGPTKGIDQCGNPYVEQLLNGRAQGPIEMRLEARDA
ncbi:MAG: ATP-binding cassette domain-containing protein [Alphaproteobacteria bacterium]|nr:ATP-binding cassette domain-containing protein [Alphaproteobacteria bacterium]